MMDERRKYPRLDMKLPVTYREAPAQVLTPSVSRNLGAGGICIRVSQPLELGTSLVIEATLPDYGDLRFEGTVVWCRTSQATRGRVVEVGVEFTRIDPKDRDAILTRTSPAA